MSCLIMAHNIFNLNLWWAWLGRLVVPLFLVFTILYLGALPQILPLPHQAANILALSAMSYWVLLSPYGFSWVLMILLAIFADALYAQPQGTSLMVWAVVLSICHHQRRFLLSQRLTVIWAMLALLMLFALQFAWVLTGLFRQNWGQWWLWLPAWLWCVATMPLVMLVVDPAQKLVQQWQPHA